MPGRTGRHACVLVAECNVFQWHHSRRLHIGKHTFLFAVLTSECKNKLLSQKDESHDAHYYFRDRNLRVFRPNPRSNFSGRSSSNGLHGGSLPLWVEHRQTQQEGGNRSCNQFVV
jgi:hypothetical protein